MMGDQERLNEALSGRYQIEGELGSGGMANVYLARDLKHSRRVAIKVLKPDLTQAVGAERFLREVEIAANLTHPHILPLFDSGEADGLLFYVMPHVEGESLRERLDREKQLPVDDAVRITREIAHALAFAHEKGIVHRDVKPANILFEAGLAVLADFGIAQAVANVEDSRLTGTGVSLGTPSYMSPEQASGEHDVDGRSDQYALGCVLYEMLTGQPPFSGRTAESLIRQHVMAEPTPVEQIRTTVPTGMARALDRALAKAPADRFSGCGELGEALAEPGRFAAAPSGPRWSPVAMLTGLVAIAAAGLVITTSVLRPTREIPSIAVVPADSAADLVGEDIYLRLGPVIGLDVKAFHRAGQLDDIGTRAADIGSALRARYLLRVSVREIQDDGDAPMVRVTADLVRVAGEEPVWTESYLTAMAWEARRSLPARIAESIVRELDIKLAAPSRRAMEQSLTDDSLAMKFFMEARRVGRSAGTSVNARAAELLDSAITHDSTLALAYASQVGLFASIGGEDRAHTALENARRLDPGMPEIGFAEGAIAYFQGRYEEALGAWRVYLETRPSDSEARLNVGLAWRRLGRWDEALESMTRAYDLDSWHPNVMANLIQTHQLMRNYEELERLYPVQDRLQPADSLRPVARLGRAMLRVWYHLQSRGDVAAVERELRHAADEFGLGPVVAWLVTHEPAAGWFGLSDWGFRADLRTMPQVSLPGLPGPFVFYLARAESELLDGNRDLAAAYFDSAHVVMERVGQANPDRPLTRSWLGIARAGVGQTDEAILEAEKGLRLYDQRTISSLGGEGYYRWYLARTLVMAGEHDRAIAVLDTLVTRPSAYSKVWLGIHPMFEPLREYPRFQALLADDGN